MGNSLLSNLLPSNPDASLPCPVLLLFAAVLLGSRAQNIPNNSYTHLVTSCDEVVLSDGELLAVLKASAPPPVDDSQVKHLIPVRWGVTNV